LRCTPGAATECGNPSPSLHAAAGQCVREPILSGRWSDSSSAASGPQAQAPRILETLSQYGRRGAMARGVQLPTALRRVTYPQREMFAMPVEDGGSQEALTKENVQGMEGKPGSDSGYQKKPTRAYPINISLRESSIK